MLREGPTYQTEIMKVEGAALVDFIQIKYADDGNEIIISCLLFKVVVQTISKPLRKADKTILI